MRIMSDAQKETPDYKRFLPPELHDEVDALVNYLTYIPFSRPGRCPRCGSSHISVKNTLYSVIHYGCTRCLKDFSPISGTPLKNYRFHELWPIHAKLMFAGNRQISVMKILGFKSIMSSYSREKTIEAVMADGYPKLYRYWMQYKFALDDFIPVQVANQIRQFQQWLQNTLVPEQISCPVCHSNRIRQPKSFKNICRCYDCTEVFSYLRHTSLYRSQQQEKYPHYFNMLTQGLNDVEIYQVIKISAISATSWRKLFFEQMKNMGLFELVDWIVWRRIAHDRYIHFLSRKAKNEEGQRLMNIERYNALQKNQKKQDIL